MIRFIQTIEINRPLGDVFAFLDTIENFMLWQTNLQEVHATSEMNVGSVITFIQGGLGRKLKLVAQITENNGVDTIKAASISGLIKFESSYHLSAKSPGTTQLALDNTIDPGHVFALAEPVLQHLAELRYESDLKTLKALLEHGL